MGAAAVPEPSYGLCPAGPRTSRVLPTRSHACGLLFACAVDYLFPCPLI